MYCVLDTLGTKSPDKISKDQEFLDLMRKSNYLIKKPESLEQGFSFLKKIDFDDLPSGGLQMYYRYVKGKYYSLKYRISTLKDTELLERANDQFDDIPRIAHEYGIKPRKEQYLFVRINTKFQLSKVCKGDVAIRFFDHAKRLSEHALGAYEDISGSFAWINAELESHSKSILRSHKNVGSTLKSRL